MRCLLLTVEKDITEVKKILDEYGIERVMFDSFYHRSNINSVGQVMESADFIFAIYDDYPNFVFELGLAAGMKKPIFLIVPDQYRLPTTLSSTTYVLSNKNEYEKIKFNFELFLNNLSLKNKSNKVHSPSAISKNILSKNFLSSLPDLNTIRGQEFENIISKILKELKIEIYSENKTKDLGIDFSIWVDDENFTLPNPIVIETKSTHRWDSLKNGCAQLARYMDNSNARMGLLIFNDPKKLVSKSSLITLNSGNRIRHNDFIIIPISIQDFIIYLSKESLVKVLQKLRNNLFH